MTDLIDALSIVGPISAKRFFGGTALVLGQTQFAFFVKGELYFRVDDGNRQVFENCGSAPFQYGQSNGKLVTVKAFYSVPEQALDDRAELCRLARGAIEAGMRLDLAKRKPEPKVGKATCNA